MKKRKLIPVKLKALLQQEINSACPFCTLTDVDHFQIHHIDENPDNNEASNLLMLCPTCHSKITKGDILPHEVRRKKMILQNRKPQVSVKPSRVSTFYGPIDTAILGDHNSVTVRVTKTSKQKYPPGCIGYDPLKANYISYLIDRYHKLKNWEVGEAGTNYAIFFSHLKKRFKIGASRTIYNAPEEQFEALASYIQTRIRGTKLARMKHHQRHYSSFSEYANEIAEFSR